METSSIGAGIGSSGLVGQIATIDVMSVEAIPKILVIQFLLPLLLIGVLGIFFRKKGWIKDGDLKLED